MVELGPCDSPKNLALDHAVPEKHDIARLAACQEVFFVDEFECGFFICLV